MNVTLQLDREPVQFDLSGAVAGVSVSIRRLNPMALTAAQTAVQQTMSNSEELLIVLARNRLLPEGGETVWRSLPETDLEAYLEAMVGISNWLSAVELGVRALSDWAGFHDDQGKAHPMTRLVIEAAMLIPDFQEQVLARIDECLAVRLRGAAQ
ncbi:hypothetical protein [Brevundimonas sp.]|uniref:hypothetical protein n=1 Tax=Brevundimonas sp. TaxID=1871086 RepID=UPI00286C1147|nr:hypothetical protein [Brevundimonas sp.]